MPTLTLTFDHTIAVPDTTQTVADVAGMLDAIDEHDGWTLSCAEPGTDSFVMLSDDERTAWYVLTMPSLGMQVDTFTLAPETVHIVNRDHADGTGGAGRVRCECGSRTFTTTDPTDVDRFVGTFTCTVCKTPWQTRNIVQRLQAVPVQ